MIVAVAILAAVCIWPVIAGYIDRAHLEATYRTLLDEERRRNESLLNRVQAGTLGEYVGAQAALAEDPFADPPPDGWHTDDTGLITDPYWRDDREA